MERKQLIDDWLAQRLETLRPGWRGRLLLTVPEEVSFEHAHDELVGTVEGDPQLERDTDSGELLDAEITFCTNWRDGAFVPMAGETRVTVCLSQVEDMQPL